MMMMMMMIKGDTTSPTIFQVVTAHKNAASSDWKFGQLTIRRGAEDDSELQAGQVLVTLGDRRRRRTASSRVDELSRTPPGRRSSPSLPRATPSRRPPTGEDTACSRHVLASEPARSRDTPPCLIK